jgi:hypothetical protein
VIDELSLTGASEWRGVIRLFEGSLEWVVDRIPTDLEDERVYAEALEQLTESPEVVLRVLLKWPSVDWGRARELFGDKDGERWFRVRVLVLERAGAVEEALNLALGERDLEEVLRLVGVHAGQREWILEHIVSVLSLDARRVSAWLVDRLQAFPMQEVVVRATRAPFLLLVYLEEAFQRQATLVVPWKREMARLATQFGNPQIVEKLVRQLVWEASELEELLGLDKTSDALVLWKLDRPYEALELLVGERDFSRATQFAEELGDPVLWDCVLQRLIETGDDSCLDAFLSGLSGELLVKTSAKIWACKRFRLTDTVKQSLAKIDRDARMKGLVLRITLNEQRQRGRAKSGCVRRATTLGDCCFCGRAMVAKGPEWQLESLSIKEEHPNSNCQNPAVAVFEDGRIAHASCLIDRKIR